MKTVACRLDLGQTRVAGYVVYESDTMEFQELTPKIAYNLVQDGFINGLALNEQGEIVPDLQNWNLGNLKIKSGVGNYRNYAENTGKNGTVYSVVRVIYFENFGRVYELISNKCARFFFKEAAVLELSKLAWVGGIFVDQESGKLSVCPMVIQEDGKECTLVELGAQVFVQTEEKAKTPKQDKNSKSKTSSKKKHQ